MKQTMKIYFVTVHCLKQIPVEHCSYIDLLLMTLNEKQIPIPGDVGSLIAADCDFFLKNYTFD